MHHIFPALVFRKFPAHTSPTQLFHSIPLFTSEHLSERIGALQQHHSWKFYCSIKARFLTRLACLTGEQEGPEFQLLCLCLPLARSAIDSVAAVGKFTEVVVRS